MTNLMIVIISLSIYTLYYHDTMSFKQYLFDINVVHYFIIIDIYVFYKSNNRAIKQNNNKNFLSVRYCSMTIEMVLYPCQ